MTESALPFDILAEDNGASKMLDRSRAFAHAKVSEKTPILAELRNPKLADGVAELRLYDSIDSWGGPYGVSAKEFAEALDALPEDTTEIHLHVNSPGGDSIEGVAILNLLRQHKAQVTVIVDGLAASAASYIACAGELVMAPNSELMVHDAWGMAVGNAADMREMVDMLDHISDNIASIYAEKAGGTVEEWRTVMAAETWFSAEEAVASKLADRILTTPQADATKAKARFDLTVFAHAGRAHAPAPRTPVASAAGRAAASGTTPKEDAVMADTLTDGLRQRLGIPADVDADEATLLAALDEALAEHPEVKPDETENAVNPAALAEIARLSTELADLKNENGARSKAELFASWLRDGKTSKAELQTLEATYNAAPEQTKALIDARAKGSVVPVAILGGNQDDEQTEDDRLYAELYGTDKKVS